MFAVVEIKLAACLLITVISLQYSDLIVCTLAGNSTGGLCAQASPLGVWSGVR